MPLSLALSCYVVDFVDLYICVGTGSRGFKSLFPALLVRNVRAPRRSFVDPNAPVAHADRASAF